MQRNVKENSKINQIAKDYLSNDPTAWLRFSEKLALTVSEWGAQAVEEAGGMITEVELKDIVLPELLSPTLITLVSKGMNPREIIEEVSRLIDEVVSKVEAGIEFKPYKRTSIDDLNYWLGDDRPFDDKFGYSVVDLSLNRYRLEETIADQISDEQIIKTIAIPIANASENIIFRLDSIDPMLYKLLLDHPELLRTLDWRTFERLLADALESLEYEIELQKGTKDGGVDIFAIKRSGVMGPQRFLIQAKRYKNRVGVDPVRQLMFLHLDHRATKVCLATTSTFTRGAWQLAEQYKWQLELRDFQGVHDWIRQAAKQKFTF